MEIANLINLFGWALGFALYAMLLLMTFRSALRSARYDGRRGFDLLPPATALLGLLWNAGSIITHTNLETQVGGWWVAAVGAVSLSALGFLPAVVVHSVMSDLHPSRGERAARFLTFAAYALSIVAALSHFHRVVTTGASESRAALLLLTVGFALVMVGLFTRTRGQSGARRAIWATALAVFAVSALHLSGEAPEPHTAWYVELVGHHASLPLALAILLQDYRFAFADIFLKRALALLLFVAALGGAFAIYVRARGVGGQAALTTDALDVLLLLALGTAAGLLYPRLKRVCDRFVDRVVLRRLDYDEVRGQIARDAQTHEEVAPLLDAVSVRLARALTAAEVRWSESAPRNERTDDVTGEQAAGAMVSEFEDLVLLPSRNSAASFNAGGERSTAVVNIPTAEAPRYNFTVGALAGGRRLLSDDAALLEWVAVTLARRIDITRHTHERCEQDRRAEQVAKLATEAQLSALRAQINPHFLFNALTTIGYLIQTSPERALSTLMRLTDLLRRVLRQTTEWATLDDELRLVEAYLDIERARFEERLRVLVDVPEELRELSVPSLIVQPLIENAIKHGIAPKRAGGEVFIKARIINAGALGEIENGGDIGRENAAAGDSMLAITVSDTGAGAEYSRARSGVGIGLANVEQRLRLCCGGRARLKFESAPGRGATVELLIPLKRAPHAGRAERVKEVA